MQRGNWIISSSWQIFIHVHMPNVDPPPASVNKAVSFCRKGERSKGRQAFMPQRKSIPEQMTAIGFDVPGSAEVLKPMVRPVPQPAKNEVLIRVAAAGVNRPAILQRRGASPPPAGASDLPGLSVSGEVVAGGSEAAQRSEER